LVDLASQDTSDDNEVSGHDQSAAAGTRSGASGVSPVEQGTPHTPTASAAELAEALESVG
jgi:hypothetical protein